MSSIQFNYISPFILPAAIGTGVGVITGIGASTGAQFLVNSVIIDQVILWLGREVLPITEGVNPLIVKVATTTLSVFAAYKLSGLMGYSLALSTRALIAISLTSALVPVAFFYTLLLLSPPSSTLVTKLNNLGVFLFM